MAISPSRRLACDVLWAVEEVGGYASDLLHRPGARGLSLADRRLATEIVMGVLRWQAQLDFVISRAARRPPARIERAALLPLRMAAYQMRFLDRIPVMAAVHESVELAKAREPRLAGFVNAVLRHLPSAPVGALLAGESDLGRRREVELSHPHWLLERWSARFGPEAVTQIAAYNNATPPVALRVSGDRGAVAARIEAEGITLAPGILLADAARVVAGDVTKTEAFRTGAVAIQDEASQLMAALLAPGEGHAVLDACAAPGGKTAVLRQLAPTARIMALDLHAHRVRLLQRLVRDGSIVAVQCDASRPLPVDTRFDRILVDAPCTGTGTLARNPEIRWRLQASDPQRLAETQGAILENVAGYLKPGGRLVYSVCSLEAEEGPGVVEALRRRLAVVPAMEALGEVDLRMPAAEMVRGDYLEILPGQFGTDGFFAAVFTR